MKISNLFSFKKDNTQPELKKTTKAMAGLYDEVAVNELVEMMVKVPDIDEVLKQAGVPRHRLSVLMYDDEIAQAIETRLDALLGLNLRLEPTETEQSKFIMKQMLPNIHSIVSGAFQARLFGYSVLECVYKRTEDNRIGIDFIGEKPMAWFVPKGDGRLFYFRTGYMTNEGEEVDQQFKFMLTRNGATYANPYGNALLSRLYWPWFFRQNGWKFWGKFLERFGAPLLVGKSTDPTAMVSALLQAHSQAVMGIDREDEVTAIGPQGGNSGQAFNDFETAVIRRIQKVVLGQTLTSGTDGGSGNRALGQVHNAIREDKIDSDIKLILPTLQKVADALCLLNNFSPVKVMYSTEASLEPARATRDKDLYAVGVRFTDTYFEDNYGLTPDDFTVTDATPINTDPNAVDKTLPPVPADKAKKDKAVAKAAREFLLSFTKDTTKLTQAQQLVEDVADEALSKAGQPLNSDLIKAAVFAASSPEDLQDRLTVLFANNKDMTNDQFGDALEDALRQVQILGYVQSESNNA